MKWIFLLAVLSVDTNAVKPSVPTTDPLSRIGITAATVQDLEFEQNDGELSTELRVDGAPVTLILKKRSVRADGFAVFVTDRLGGLTAAEVPPVSTYSGSVPELPGARVRASFADGMLHAIIFSNARVWVVQPQRDGVSGRSPSSAHVVYDAEDLLVAEAACGATSTVGRVSGSFLAATVPDPADKICELACDSDYEFFLQHGSVESVIREIESIVNGVNAVFGTDETRIQYELTTIIVRTSPGAFVQTEADALLEEFFWIWETPPERDLQGDLAHLFTGKDLDGDVIGNADLDRVCWSNIAGGLSQSTLVSFVGKVALTAHELAHNFSALHCDSETECRIMCSDLGGCGGLVPLAFAPVSAMSIAQYRQTLTCLHDEPITLDLPFVDPFAGPTLDTDLWTYRSGVVVSADASDEPSEPYSVQLNSLGTPYGDDDLRSAAINLDGASVARLSYQVQRSGVLPGGVLCVGYLSSDGTWASLNTLVSDSTSLSGFSRFEHALPQDARHQGFRIRFRVVVSGPDESWYIDDVAVLEEGTVRQDFVRGDCNSDGAVDLADPIASLEYQFARGCLNCLDASDVNDDGAIDIADVIFALSHLFSAGRSPASPFPNLGLDPTPDALGCDSYTPCGA